MLACRNSIRPNLSIGAEAVASTPESCTGKAENRDIAAALGVASGSVSQWIEHGNEGGMLALMRLCTVFSSMPRARAASAEEVISTHFINATQRRSS